MANQAGKRPLPEVFLNCPFDDAYRPLYQAIVFTVMALGYQVRMALEIEDSAQSRLAKIVGIIRETPYGIHDISRAGVDPDSGLARFNMPLELGLFLGAKAYGGTVQQRKIALILDTERHRYQRFISDIAGNDIQAHKDDPRNVVTKVRNWLATHAGAGTAVLGGAGVFAHYQRFLVDLPAIQDRLGHDDDLPFVDYQTVVRHWLAGSPLPDARAS
ncbi:hypothetical protein [Zavarzinia compransoris]|uniref:Uncharacterized protein n=1 Tax=Zavarzinia compransoris TaxID=1264899 RepID=A0A317E5C5_9PROT|nr:hypothetical protein [Zavarzinia compransoris]PWR21554.1 hypothetical protein DKG75_05985 [Zavarzinia compransoris]TDP45678.1 hypothetical protein DES42_105385 [Zavarzinia compransoris]